MSNLAISKSTSYFLALIFPITSLFISIRDYQKPEAKNLFWLFCIFLGMIHIVFPTGGSSADGTRYAFRLIELHQYTYDWASFREILFTEKFVDLYQPVITYLIAFFTNDPRWLFTVFAIVFGFFYSRNMWFLLEKLPAKKSFIIWVLIAFYFLICPIWEINGVRMWTAAHVFLYGALPYIWGKDYSKLIWCLLSIFIHFSFFTPVCILVGYIIVPKHINLLLIAFLTSFIIKSLDMGQVRELLSYLPDFLQTRVRGYTSEAVMESFLENKSRSDSNWFVNTSIFISRWAIAILLTYISTVGKKIIKNNKSLRDLLCFTLFLYSIANILSLIPSGSRFITISNLFALPAIIFYFYQEQEEHKRNILSYMIKVVVIMLVFPIILSIRIGFDYYGISLLTNPIIAFFIPDNTPIIQFVKYLFS